MTEIQKMRTKAEKQRIGALKNKLLRYQDVVNYYYQIKAENRYITIVALHRDFIYPKYHISRVTFYNILRTPIQKELKELSKIINNSKITSNAQDI